MGIKCVYVCMYVCVFGIVKCILSFVCFNQGSLQRTFLHVIRTSTAAGYCRTQAAESRRLSEDSGSSCSFRDQDDALTELHLEQNDWPTINRTDGQGCQGCAPPKFYFFQGFLDQTLIFLSIHYIPCFHVSTIGQNSYSTRYPQQTSDICISSHPLIASWLKRRRESPVDITMPRVKAG